MNASLSAGKNIDPHSPEFISAVKQWVDEHFETFVKQLGDIVAYPSLAFDGYDRDPLHASADVVEELFSDVGLTELRQVTETRGEAESSGPAILGRKPGHKNKPTVLLYAHHDVQPVGELAAWESDPWVATERQGRLYGRGTADDKAGIIVHRAAITALNELLGDDHGLGLAVFIEGEEEVGSPFFHQFLENHREALAADTIIVADAANWTVETPSLTTSLRGMIDGVIEVTVADHPVHSGIFGGPVLDAVTILSKIIATLHDPHGDVAIDGLQQNHWSDVHYDEVDFRNQTGVVDGLQLTGTGSLADRLWNRAALNIIGIDATPIAESSNSIIDSAQARFSMRIGPGMDPVEIMNAFIQHVEAVDVHGATVEVHPGEMGRPFVVNADAVATDIMKQALTDAWGATAIESGLGGSIPVVADLVDAYPNANILLTGVADPDTKAHAPNESLDLSVLRHAIEAQVLVLARMAHTR